MTGVGGRGELAPSGLIRCACGRLHGDVHGLAKLGWRKVGSGAFALNVQCGCGAILTLARIDDASQCSGCARVVTGTDGDVKVCAIQNGRSVVYCLGCANRRFNSQVVRRGVRPP